MQSESNSVILLILSCVALSSESTNFRNSRAVQEIFLSDPLDCLSQLICGLNTFPPHVPSPRTSSANDYAYLLQHVILRLKKQRPDPTQPPTPPSTSTTSTTTPAPLDEEEDDEGSEESEENTTAEKHRKKLLKHSKDQYGDLVELKKVYPPLGIFNFVREARKITSKKVSQKKTKKNPKTKTTPRPRSQLEELKDEQDIKTKLRSDAQCMYGILDHTCPFKYSELLILMSGVLERQKVMSYTSNRILPMVGYLLKSRSLTQTMKSTFFALERINNITLTKNHNNLPFEFKYIYDEIVRGEFGGNGLHLVETKIDAPASSHIYEDDEFDYALNNPVISRNKIFNTIKKVEDSGEKEQELFDNKENKDEEYDENESDNSGGESTEIKDIPLPPVYGSSGRKSSLNRRRRY